VSWGSSPEITRHTLGRRFPAQLDAVTDWISQSNRGEFPVRMAFVVVTDTPVGLVQIDQIDYVAQNAWMGVWLIPEVRAEGLGRQVVTRVLAIARDTLNLRQLRLIVRSDNVVAIRLYKSLGFVHEGRLERAEFREGDYLNVDVMRLEFL